MDKGAAVWCRLYWHLVDEAMVYDGGTDVGAGRREMEDLVNMAGAEILRGEVEGLRSGKFGGADEYAIETVDGTDTAVALA